MANEIIPLGKSDDQMPVPKEEKPPKKEITLSGAFGGRKKFTRLLVSLLIGIVVLVAGWAVYSRYFAPEKSALGGILTKKKQVKKDTRVIAPLDGTLAEPELANRNPLGIVIENHPDARPQTGLTEASVVFEAIAEGGITRFLALYGPMESEKVGPVRSARTYFVDWALGFGAYFAHVGGNIDALDQIRSDKVLDLDQFANAGAYYREPRVGVASEHTMFTDTKSLYKVGESKYGAQAAFKPFKFKKEAPVAERGKDDSIIINFSQPSYLVEYTFDPKTNTYLRELGGVAHKDAQSGKQLAPKVVVAMEVSGQPVITRINENGWSFKTVGGGKATVLQDGNVLTGKWKKEGKKEPLQFFDQSDKEIEFNPGQIWIEVIAAGASFEVPSNPPAGGPTPAPKKK